MRDFRQNEGKQGVFDVLDEGHAALNSSQEAPNLDHLSPYAKMNHLLELELQKSDRVLAEAHAARMKGNHYAATAYEQAKAYQEGLQKASEILRREWKR